MTHPTPADQVLAQWQADETRLRAVHDGQFGVAKLKDIASLTGLQMMQALMAGALPAPTISKTLRFGLVEVAHGKAVFQGAPNDQLLNPMGTMHGGWYATLLDSALGCAVHTTMPLGRGYTTLEIKVNIVRGVSLKVPLVRAVGTTIHVGRQTATAEAILVGHDGTLYAHASTTCLVFDQKM
jgi:uncharacterized protein (TIGR00369 family)